MLRFLIYLFLLGLFILGISLTLLNANSVAINYLIGNTMLPLPVLMLLAFILGSVLATIALLGWVIKLKRSNHSYARQQKRLIKILEKHNIVFNNDN